MASSRLNEPSRQQIQQYLESVPVSGRSGRGREKKRRIHVEYFGPLSEYGKEGSGKDDEKKSKDIKKLGYGSPYLIVYGESQPGGKVSQKKAILSTMRIGFGFGHDYRADRVDNTVLSFDTWNSLPQHVKVWDIGAFDRADSTPLSLGRAGEFFLLRPMVQGAEYYKDLDRIFESGKLEEGDLERAESLANYLAKIHKVKYRSAGREEVYVRKIRDTVGHGECIFGLADSYPMKVGQYLREGELEEIEKKCVAQRWKLRSRSDRLSQVHGDFHPWNILFQKTRSGAPSKFVILDRSRGAWGEPADDVCALSVNYLFYSLRKYGDVRNEFEELFDRFMKTYLEKAKDEGLPEAMPLFYVFRALVIASPVWYPDLQDGVRRKIFNFTQNLLDEGIFDYLRVNDYFRGVSS